MALLACPECAHTLSDKAYFCPGCGYPTALAFHPPESPSPYVFPALPPLQTPAEVKGSAAARKRQKLPNGFGCIKKLSGNRSRPYAAYPSSKGLPSQKETGQTLHAIGYYEDWYAAYNALSEFHKRPYDISSRALTFADVYRLFYDEKFSPGSKSLSSSSRYAYDTAFKNSVRLHSMRFIDIRKADMQSVINNCTLGYSSVCNLKKLFCQMYRYALENDVVEKDYSKFVTINRDDDNEKGEPFTPEELELLWAHKKDRVVQMILLMIYTGFRIKAFETIELNAEEQYFKGGVKTTAGKGRIVPIHDCVLPFALQFRTNFPRYSAKCFRSNYFYPAMERLGIATTASGKKRTPHDCRHTFSWLCDKYKVDELSKHLLMGHSLGKDVERAVYGHRTLEELRAEISKIRV